MSTVIRDTAALAPRPDLRVVPARRRWNPLLVGVGLLCVLGGGLTFATIQLKSSGAAVLALARPVAAGQVIETGDLRVVHVAVSDAGVDRVAATDEDAVVGHVAAVPLLAGELLTHQHVGPSVAIPPGNAEVGVSLRAGQFPADLAQGERVWVVDTSAVLTPAGTDSGPSRVALPVAAVVLSIQTLTDDPQQATAISLLVPQNAAAQVASVAAAGHANLVLVPSTP